MANDNLLRVTLKALADYIVANVDGLDMVHVGQAEPEDVDGTPCATLLPRGGFPFDPSLGLDEVTSGMDDVALTDVGCFEGNVEFQVSAKFPAQREELEGRILALFMTRKRRGVLVLKTPRLRVNDRVTLYEAPVAFSLLSHQWADEAAFDKKRYTYITLEVAYPALVAEDCPTIEAYHAALSEDLTSVDPVTESIAIDEDGNVTPDP